MNSSQNMFTPNYATHPGLSLLEYIEYENITKKDFALSLGISLLHLGDICQEKVPLTAEVANALEKVTGISASFWNNLQMRYDEQKIKMQEDISSELVYI